jgi:hypothetical protein
VKNGNTSPATLVGFNKLRNPLNGTSRLPSCISRLLRHRRAVKLCRTFNNGSIMRLFYKQNKSTQRSNLTIKGSSKKNLLGSSVPCVHLLNYKICHLLKTAIAGRSSTFTIALLLFIIRFFAFTLSRRIRSLINLLPSSLRYKNAASVPNPCFPASLEKMLPRNGSKGSW